jgi:hypothetical protein
LLGIVVAIQLHLGHIFVQSSSLLARLRFPKVFIFESNHHGLVALSEDTCSPISKRCPLPHGWAALMAKLFSKTCISVLPLTASHFTTDLLPQI